MRTRAAGRVGRILVGVCVSNGLGCERAPVVTTRTVTLHAPQNCAAGLANLDGAAFGTYRELGDFDAPAPAGGHLIGPAGVALPEIDTAARALLVEAVDGDRPWQGVSEIAAAGAIDVLLLPASTSCALRGALTERSSPTIAAVGSARVLIVGGHVAMNAALPPTTMLRLDTGAVESVLPDLLTPRNEATVTAFGDGALVAGGVDARSGTVLDRAEVYDPDLGGFDQQHPVALSMPRAEAAAAVLATGETLLVGGVGTDGTTALDSMEIVDPVTRTVRAESVARLAIARISPTVLRLPSGEILVTGGVTSTGVAVPTLEWFSSDVSHPTKPTQDLVTGLQRSTIALEGGGALAVVAPPIGAGPAFQNTWVIDSDGVLEPATPIPGSLTNPVLFGGAGGAPALWTGDRWLRWQPWAGAFVALGALDDVPDHVGTIAASPDPGLALWLDVTNARAPALTALRFDVRSEYSELIGPLLVSDTDETSPDRLATDGAVSFDPSRGLTLASGASAFVVDRTYADVRLELDAPTGEPALVVLRDSLGDELEIGGVSCPGAAVAGAASSLTVERHGASVTWSVSGSAPSGPEPCTTHVGSDARLSVGVRGAPDRALSVARNLRISRLGSP